MNKNLKFEEGIPPRPRKTKIYSVINNHDGATLGSIYWQNGWRQYVFEPQTECIWSDGCLEELLKFMKELRR